jgi:hypothetical protein
MALVVVDVETAGEDPARHHLIAIGAAVLLGDGTVASTHCWVLDDFSDDMSGSGWSPRCVAEFWGPSGQQPQLLRTLTSRHRVSPTVAASELLKVITDAYDAHGSVALGSDYPCFDVAWVNALLLRTGHTTINMATGRWLPCIDTDSFADGVKAAMGRPYTPPAGNELTHVPEEDAAIIARSHAYHLVQAGMFEQLNTFACTRSFAWGFMCAVSFIGLLAYCMN